MRDINRIFVYVAYGCGSVLLQQGDEIQRRSGNFVFFPVLTMHCMGRIAYEFRYEGPILLKFTYLL